MNTPEGKVKEACKAVLKKWNIWYYMPVQNGMGVTGIPDIICCWDGRFLGIECKAPGKIGSTTPNQRRVLQEICTHNGLSIVVDGAHTLEQFLVVNAVAQRLGENLNASLET